MDPVGDDPDGYIRRVDFELPYARHVASGYTYVDEMARVQRMTWKGAILDLEASPSDQANPAGLGADDGRQAAWQLEGRAAGLLIIVEITSGLSELQHILFASRGSVPNDHAKVSVNRDIPITCRVFKPRREL